MVWGGENEKRRNGDHGEGLGLWRVHGIVAGSIKGKWTRQIFGSLIIRFNHEPKQLFITKIAKNIHDN